MIGWGAWQTAFESDHFPKAVGGVKVSMGVHSKEIENARRKDGESSFLGVILEKS